MVELRVSRSYGSALDPKEQGARPLAKSCVGPGLVLWSTGEVLNFNLTGVNWPPKHRAVTGDYSCHDQHPVFIPALTQYQFYWHEWLTSSRPVKQK